MQVFSFLEKGGSRGLRIMVWIMVWSRLSIRLRIRRCQDTHLLTTLRLKNSCNFFQDKWYLIKKGVAIIRTNCPLYCLLLQPPPPACMIPLSPALTVTVVVQVWGRRHISHFSVNASKLNSEPECAGSENVNMMKWVNIYLFGFPGKSNWEILLLWHQLVFTLSVLERE